MGPGQTQQVKCLFKEAHRNADSRKSARIYSDSDKYFCFACQEHPIQAWELYAQLKDVPKDRAILEMKALGMEVTPAVRRETEEDKVKKKELFSYFSTLIRDNFSQAIFEIRKHYKVA